MGPPFKIRPGSRYAAGNQFVNALYPCPSSGVYYAHLHIVNFWLFEGHEEFVKTCTTIVLPGAPPAAGNRKPDRRSWQPNAFSVRWAFVLLLGLLGFTADFATPRALGVTTNFFLIVDQEGAGRPAHFAFLSGLRKYFSRHLSGEYELYIENLDPGNFFNPAYRQRLLSSLETKYRGRKLDAIVTLGGVSLDYMLEARSNSWPQVPIVFSRLSTEQANPFVDRPHLTGVTVDLDASRTLSAALALCPDTQQIAVISSGHDAPRADVALHEHLEHIAAEKLQIIPLIGLTPQETKQRLAMLPPQTIVIFQSILIEGGYQVLTQRDALAELSTVSRSPLFSFADIFIGFGTVGGHCVVYPELGAEVAQQVIEILRSGGTRKIPILNSRSHHLIFDWREMQRWSLDVQRLPPDSEVRFQPPTLWEAHREAVLIALTALILQTALIIALLVQRYQRQLAENALREQRIQLAHASRVSSMGQLASSLAHELNQPLGAILRNAEAAELMLQNPAPELGEVRTVLSDIRRDDQRAGEVIDRMRALLRKHELASEPVAVPELVKEVVALVKVDAAHRQISCQVLLESDLPPVRGDRVHLQQVLLNLLLNAMDSLTRVAEDARRIVIEAGLTPTARIEVSVTDSGPGIPQDSLAHIFQPFFTTKADGMGMGLSISRTIIEAHGGRLWAENRPEGGAAFRFTLPILALGKTS